ncbi:uncharacterized protein FFB20_06395 [Fusarium fujikuroi]|nr:uncharacterized protein FFE2_00551 [Fusarium fujikuroi]SCN69536.1 uncharacterized protein FFC1_00547 [Fusarium fujikuroi]SCN72822.1 uncharacterized protein FFM5_00512 [Fusarium fujikuroi]SCN81243.1 uncharacterized protein FFB20_06395 [Fusarium fujikuroi]SCO28807.1 uncharacterized protein FFNC_00551 [Fusarium fujikuroi]
MYNTISSDVVTFALASPSTLMLALEEFPHFQGMDVLHDTGDRGNRRMRCCGLSGTTQTLSLFAFQCWGHKDGDYKTESFRFQRVYNYSSSFTACP